MKLPHFGPVAASVLAGFLGASVADVVVTALRANGPAPLGGVSALAVGLYGAAGILTAVVVGLLTSGIFAAIATGGSKLRDDEPRDRAAAAGVLAGAIGVGVVAFAVAAGEKVLVRAMQSDLLAVIAAGGLVVLAAPGAAAVAIALYPGLRRFVAARLPRPRALGATGVLLLAGAVLGVLAAVLAFSRADWRVLDLGPFAALAVAVIAGLGHGLFWYGSTAGRRLGARMPSVLLSHGVVALVFLALFFGARLPETSPAFVAAEDGSLGLRLGLKVARRATDGDKDGFSARFGGGDCDDGRADVHPGAEDVPGDGIDGNCEGGDAVASAGEAAGGDEASGGEDSGGSAQAGSAGSAAQAGAPAADRAIPAWTGNLLLVTIDALRADRLGVAGYERPKGKSLTPNLDTLARRGAYFRRVWSQAPNTPRSFPSILTSRHPSAIRWDNPGVNYPVVLPENHTVFEDLAQAGLRPIGIFSHFYFTRERGISKAFKEWSNEGAGTIAESNKDIAAPRIVPQVIARLEKAAAARERFALWTHLFEPHSSYMAHKDFPLSAGGGVAGLMEKYDFEIAFVDRWVGKLLDAVRKLGLEENTAVVVMADHGEAWGEHKVYFHGQDLFEEQLRIPLIIAVPGQAPIVVDDPVSAIDVAPTLVDLVGAPLPRSFRGRSLLPLVAGKSEESASAAGGAPRPVYAELLPATAWPHHAVMMVDGGKKIIHRVSAKRWELYDLATDPGEKRNLADDPQARPVFEAMRAKLIAFEERKR